MELQVVKSDNSKAKSIAASEVVFGRPYNEALIHQVVTAYMASGRQGTQQQKTRSDVSGGGAKPWKQKGTGRARAGTSRSPLWRKGGVTFAARPRSYVQKINRKMYRAALQSIFSELVRSGRLVVVDQLTVDQPKTKLLKQALTGMSLSDVLIVTHDVTENLYLAARNLPYVDVRDIEHIDPVSLVAYEKVLITVDAVKQVEEQLS